MAIYKHIITIINRFKTLTISIYHAVVQHISTKFGRMTDDEFYGSASPPLEWGGIRRELSEIYVYAFCKSV